MQTTTTRTPLTIQDARKLAIEGWRNYVALTSGRAWWETELAAPIRAASSARAKQVVAQQNAEREPTEAPVPAPVTEGFLPKVEVPVVEPKAPVTPVTEPEAMLKLRAEAHALFPSDRTQASTTKHNKAQAMRRRSHLIKHGAPRVALKPGQVVFGKVIA